MLWIFLRFHVRRTDKLYGDAFYIPIENFVKHADNYFDLLELIRPAEKGEKRVVYLATDDKSLFAEVNRK